MIIAHLGLPSGTWTKTTIPQVGGLTRTSGTYTHHLYMFAKPGHLWTRPSGYGRSLAPWLTRDVKQTLREVLLAWWPFATSFGTDCAVLSVGRMKVESTRASFSGDVQ